MSSLLPLFNKGMCESQTPEQELAKLEEACKLGRAAQKSALQNTEQPGRAFVKKAYMQNARKQNFCGKEAIEVWRMMPTMK